MGTSAHGDRDGLRAELLRQRLAGKGRGHKRREPARADRNGPLRLSHGQQQMWFLNRLEPDSPEYLVPLALRLRGPLDVPALARAWDRFLARHEILRTRYVWEGTEPVQVIDPVRPVELPVEDLSRLAGTEREAAVRERIARASKRPVDLEREWPVRGRLLRCAADEHVLIVVVHHIACDAWSAHLFAQDISALYAAGPEDGPEPLTFQYADYAAWEREQLAGEGGQRHLEYWRQQLAGLTQLALPTDRPRPAVRDHRGDSVVRDLSDELADAVRDLAKRHETTPFTVLLTAFQALLARYTGADDIAVGTLLSTRNRPEWQSLFGYGINSLVLRGRLDGDPAFDELLSATRATVLDAFEHQDVPFPQLVTELEPERDQSRTPLFQVLFTLREETVDDYRLPGVSMTGIPPAEPPARFDLSLVMNEGRDGALSARLEFATALFDRATAERMVSHFVRLLAAAVARPETRLSRVEILGPDERALLAGGPEIEWPVTRRVHELFEEQVGRTPDAGAVTFGGRTLSYAELNARANRVAHLLRAKGVGPEDLVGLCLERDGELLPALLGVLKAGAAYLPLDPANPADRLAYIVRDAGARVVLSTSAVAGVLQGRYEGELVLLDRDAGLIAAQPDNDPAVGGSPQNLIYTIYTSGSTGKPKGVALTHENVARLMEAARRHLAYGESDVWSLFHSYAFDVSVFEMWGALLHGGRLVVVPFTVTRSPEEFLDLLVEEEVTVLSQTPSAFRALAAAAGERQLGLRAVVFAGEKLEASELKPWTDRLGLARIALVNMYGITETTVHTTYHRLNEQDLLAGAGNAIGRPLGDLTVRLLDGHGELVPIGVPGEIHVGGPGVARGYLNRPELTAGRFVPDPFGPAGARLYKSGDLARRLPDGSLEFLGRIDDQVKIRGFRIELGEIESALAGHPGVRDAVVVVRDERLVAYVVPAGHAPSLGELRAHLAASLPEYMIPAAFVPLDALPLTTNGKLDKRALPAPGQDVLGSGRAYVAPRTVVEEHIAEVWQEVLGLDRVSVEDGFFDLGGDSIRAVALVGALRAAGLDVAVRDIFDHRTIAGLAGLVAGRGRAVVQAAVEPFELLADGDRERLPAELADAYPMSQTQIGMVVDMLAHDRHSNYQNVASSRMRDDVSFDLDALRAAAAVVVERHDVLRTSFDLKSSSVPVQLVHPTAEIPVMVRDLRGLDAKEVERSLGAFHTEEKARLFHLAEPPLLRLTAHLVDGGWWLSVTEFHGIVEGWSYHSLVQELLACYRRLREGREPAPYTPPGVRFADSIAGELRALASDEDRAYWTRTIAGPQRFSLPEGWGEPDRPAEHFWVSVPFDDLEDGLRALAAKAGASLKSVLVAAHGKVLSTLTDQREFTSGVVVLTRPEAVDADRIYGMHLNTVPLAFGRTARTWRQLVAQAFAREAELWPHRRFPMPEMQRLAGGRRLVDVLINHVDFDRLESDAADLDSVMAPGTTEFDLAVTTISRRIGLKTNTHALSRPNAARVAALYRSVLEAMASDPDGSARESHLPEQERRRQLVEWNDSAYEAESASVLELFEAQAAKAPEEVAVRSGDLTVSYGELDVWANRIAHCLRARGVVAESRVAVRLDRGPELIASLLGVWKAGAAYVPVDVSCPAERVAAIVGTSGAKVLLDEPGLSVEGFPATAPSRVGDLDGLAYVIFTSGSTGTPKGVEVPHRGLVNHVAWAARELASRGTGGAPLFSSVAFDLVVPNLWAPLVTGQSVHTVPQSVDMADLGRHLAAEAPYSFIKLTPGHLDVLSYQLTPADAAALAPVLVVAGEAFSRATLEGWRALAPQTRLVNEYGPTEASVGTCVFEVPAETDGEVLPIGRPLPNMTMYVLDGWLEPVPVGVVGELYVGGTGVARGYASRPDLTAERFLPDPYAGEPGARFYRTGDLVRQREDGNVEFLGRSDDQVKIRGFRVELGEVQAVLAEHPAVREAFVTAHQPRSGDKQLAAYYVSDERDVHDLAAYCALRLPDYMIPATFTVLEAMPLTANGKIDRHTLPTPTETAQDTYIAPRTDTEEQIATTWREVLQRERVGAEDSFFYLGGDSIRAVALVGALRVAGFDLDVRDVFDCRTVAALAVLVADRAPAAVMAPVTPFELLADEDRERLPAGLVDAYPMSQTQTGMVVEMLADERLHRYHSVTSFRIRDELPFEPAALLAAARTVVERHEVLRTSFDLTSFSLPVQLVHPTAEIPVSVHDATSLDIQQTLRDFQADERSRPFVLSSPPLLRLAAHLEGEGAWWLSMVRCHAITEGWSHYNLLMELLNCYRRFRDGGRAEATEPADRPEVRYADFIAAEQRSLASDEDRAYWARTVEEHPTFSLPAGWGEPDGPAGESRVRLRIPIHDLEPGLRTLASRARVSLKSVLLGAHLKVLSGLTGERSFTTGLVCDARPEAVGADRVHGMYLNTVPFVHDRGRAAGSWLDLVRSVFGREVELWPHRRFPMPQMQRMAGGRRLVDVSFNYLDFHQVDQELVDVAPTLAEGGTEFDLAVTTLAGHLALSSRTGVLSPGAAERIGAMYRQVLEAMAADPDGDADEEVFLSADERSLLAELGRPAHRSGPQPTLPALWEEQAARTPHAVAVVHGATTVSYAQLEARANRVAHHLRARGVSAGTPVGVLLDREPDLVACLLGVWKAGGAYVPLDPASPRERLEFMLSDAGARILLTRRENAPQGFGRPGTLFLEDVPLGTYPATAPARETDPEHLAYVVHTSGSTGRSKGVQITHRGFAHRVAWTVREHGLGPADRILHKTSIGFDAAGWELFAPLVCGGAVVLASAGVERDPAALLRSVADHRVTVLQVVPSVLRLLVETEGWAACTALRLLCSAGEQLDGELAGRLQALCPAVELWNTYGPTECTIDATAHRVPSGLTAGPVPIGRPLPHAGARILDAGMRRVPVGVTGELHIGGAGLARGYAGRPDLTADLFVPDPYGPPGARLYRTGDLARVLPDGTIEYAGRTDDEVKINGVRVAPAETRAALLALPGVRDAVVVPWRDRRGEQRLVAYVVADDMEPAGLRRRLSATVPAALVPGAFVALDRIPLTVNGKPDRAALPAPEPAEDRTYLAPRTPVERAIAEIWSQVLGLERVSAHDNFFDYGGDSLLVIRVIGAARRRGLPLTLRMLYEYDTLAALAEAVDSLTEGPGMTTDVHPTAEPARAVPVPRISRSELQEVMAAHHVPGVSIALLRGGEVVSVEGYGVTAADRPEPVTPRTAFQVASVSKHVTMLAVLQLVGDGVLNLDADINRYLTTWQVPDGARITLRELVSHQAGLSHVAPTNYLPAELMPDIPEILGGRPPATNAPVRAEHPAGTVFKKSNINFSVLEQLLADVTAEPFEAMMRRLVLDPLSMADSTFDQNRPAVAPVPVAVGHDPDGTPIPGRWRVRNEVAAGGLWASAEDLAKVALEIRRAYLGEPGTLLSRPLAQQMLTIWHPGSFYGLGTVVDTTGGDLEYGHGGRTVGYRVGTFTRVDSGEGLIVLTNSENGKQVNTFVADAVRRADGGLGTGEMIATWAHADDEPVERAASGE
ncbi:amino acid adenylation domain-containing protein [Streptomyces sp. ISL-96]|uniref:non-ribosomal peptide synthetase n=1 Tax=Streptomyces sp. ISL-96 TaxID=2819191 RepID=UPI001BE66D00|nr:non-ribosomal peptide synthetase [Streptomyces sp. ISL-96]MBT2491922.1 amino acid adenylation domain-containing protein [Streptomyces sp. ISL-96]